MPEELEEKIIESEEVDEVLEEDFEEEEYTSSELSWRQITILIGAGIFAFLLSIVFLFPYEELTRTFVTKNAQEKGYVLEFRKLNLSLFSTKSVDHLIYQTKDNLEVRAESIEIDTSIWDLIKRNFKGNIKITSLNLELSEFALKANSVNVDDSSLIGFDRELVNMNGAFNLQIFDGAILRSPAIPMIDTLQGVTIKRILLNLKKTLNSNRLTIEKGVFTLSIAKITISGYIELAASFRDSRIDLKLCPKLTEKYSAEREDIASSLQLITKDLPDGCIPVTGTIGAPKVNMPGIQQPPPTSPSVLNPVPETPPGQNGN